MSDARALGAAPDPAVARLLADLTLVEERLPAVIARLEDLTWAAARAADRTRWQTDAATRFFECAEVWRREVALLPDALSRAHDEVARARESVQARAWGPMQ